MPGWKVTQSKRETRKRNKLALIVLSLVAGLIFLSWAMRFTQGLFTSSVPKNYRWDGEFNINLAVKTKDIAVVSYNPKDEKITIINIPDETFLEVPRRLGFWQMRAVYGLGGDGLLKETLSSFLGVPIDGFLDLSSQGLASDVVKTLRQNPVSGLNYLSSLKTDLTLWELISFKRGVSAVRFDKIKELDLVSFLDKGKLPDGTDIYTADPVRLDSYFTDLSDPAVLEEHKSIAVFNAAGKPLLAQKWARLVTTLGGNVIITANAKNIIKKTVVSGEQSKTLKRLRQIFESGCQEQPKCGKISLPDEDLSSSRAQINIFLGEDLLDR